VSQIKDAIQHLSTNDQKREKPIDYTIMLREVLANQHVLMSRLNESTVDLMLSYVRAFGTHFKNGALLLWSKTVQVCTELFNLVASWASELKQHGTSINPADVKAELLRWNDRVRDYVQRRHRQLVTMLLEQKYVPAQEQQAQLAAWGVIGIFGFVFFLILLLVVKWFCCLLCPCLRCGKRKSAQPTVSSPPVGGKVPKKNPKKNQ